MTPDAQLISELSRSYDETPYESRPFPQTHPARSAAIGRLFGLTMPDAGSARVLELGCASGGNLIPLAAQFRDASFRGIDLSPLQIEAGRQRIAGLGLGNIDLRHQSISDITPADGTFDYIICHGVYSWVPASVREAILRVASQNLSPTGVAYISYNVNPGWKLRGVLRDAMLFHVADESDPKLRVGRARLFLSQLAAMTDTATPYGQLLRQEAQAMRAYDDYYVSHDHLEVTNDPCTVSEFFGAAQKAGLTYLSEANFNVTIAEAFGADKGALLRELSGNRLEHMEQYIDYLTGRTFRQTLLVHAHRTSQIQRNLLPERLTGLHVTSHLTVVPTDKAPEAGDSFALRDRSGRTLTTNSTHVRDRMLALSGRSPGSLAIDEMISPTSADDGDRNGFLVLDALFKLIVSGMAEVSSVPVVCEVNCPPTPETRLLARADAQAGRSWTTNVRHESVTMSVVQKALLPHLDGTNTLMRLARLLGEKVDRGDIVFQRDGVPITQADEIAAATVDHLTAALNGLAQSALLAQSRADV